MKFDPTGGGDMEKTWRKSVEMEYVVNKKWVDWFEMGGRILQ